VPAAAEALLALVTATVPNRSEAPKWSAVISCETPLVPSWRTKLSTVRSPDTTTVSPLCRQFMAFSASEPNTVTR